MPTREQAEAAVNRMIANDVKFNDWLNGEAGQTVMLGDTETPTLLSIVATLSAGLDGPNAGAGVMANEGGGVDLALWDQETSSMRRIRFVNGVPMAVS